MSWEPDKTKFNRMETYPHLTQGDSVSVSVRISEWMSAHIAEIVASPKYPKLRQQSQVIRDALFRAFHDYHEMVPDEDFGNFLKFQRALVRQVNEAEEYALFGEVVKKAMDKVTVLKKLGHQKGVDQLLEEIKEAYEGIPDGYWKHVAKQVMEENGLEI